MGFLFICRVGRGGFYGFYFRCEFVLFRFVKILGCKDGFLIGNFDKFITRRREWIYCYDLVMLFSVFRAIV